MKLYKIGVKLDMTGKTAANAKIEVLEHERPERKAEMPAPDLSELELAMIRVVQDDLPNVERPFAVQAEQIGVDEQTRARHDPVAQGAQAHAPLRGGHEPSQRGLQGERDGRVGRPRRPARRDRSADGRRSPRCRTATGGPTYDDWPYSVFTMVHGRSARDCEATIDAIRTETGVDEYCLLWSVKEYKKVRLRYFGNEWHEWERENLEARTAP